MRENASSGASTLVPLFGQAGATYDVAKRKFVGGYDVTAAIRVTEVQLCIPRDEGTGEASL